MSASSSIKTSAVEYRNGSARSFRSDKPSGISSHPKVFPIMQRPTEALRVEIESTGPIAMAQAETTALRGNSISSEPLRDQLVSVRHLGGTRIALKFSDNYEGNVDLSTLGIDTTVLQPETVRVSSLGSAAEIKSKSGKTIDIDSAVLRSYCDPEYAAELRRAIAELTAL